MTDTPEDEPDTGYISKEEQELADEAAATEEPEGDIPTPAHPEPEEYPEPIIAPAAIDPTAVDTVIGGKKFGWQDEPNRPFSSPEVCVHIGVVSARAQIVAHDVGHEWICTCGQVFVVTINTGGKKTLTPKEDVVD